MPPDLRRQLANLLILTAFGLAVGRILSAELVLEPSLHKAPGETTPTKRAWPPTRPTPMPTFGSNDRSRWATVRSLVDEHSFVVGRRDRGLMLETAVWPLAASNALEAVTLFEAGYRARISNPAGVRPGWTVVSDSGLVFEDGWGTVDKVLHPARLEYYSSKPPLLSVLVAGEYWLLQKATGWTLKDQPQEVVRTILVTINALPLLLYLGLLARLLERHAATDWGRFYVLACAAFGTLVTPFLITFNNHIVGTFSAAVAVYAVCRVWEGKDGTWPRLLAGLAAAFTATNELPALSLVAGLALVLFWFDWRHGPSLGRVLGGLLPYVAGVAVPLGLAVAVGVVSGHEEDADGGAWYGKPIVWAKHGVTGWYGDFNSEPYRYEGSHWARTDRRGIDFARDYETRADYAFNLLVGHHGVFSLTPFLLLTVAGVVMGLRRFGQASEDEKRVLTAPQPPPLPWFLFPLTAVLSLVVVGFYLVRSDNYGGWSNGPRWLMWLTPLWLLTLLPAVDWLAQRRWGRALAGVLLVLSVLSVSYMAWNPRRHPWIYTWMDAQGLIPY